MKKVSNPLYKVNKENWVKKGLLILKRKGITGLKIDTLAARLKVTKGSFYHHFENYEDLEKAIAESWKNDLQKSLLNAQSNSVADSLRRFYSSVNVEEESKLRNWAQRSKHAKTAIEEIDKNRIEFLHETYTKKYSPEAAKAKAYLEYGAFIGVQQLYEHIDQRMIKSVSNEFMQLFRH